MAYPPEPAAARFFCPPSGSFIAIYPADTCAEVKIIPDAGHSLALHKNARTFFDTVEEWSDRRVGASSNRPPRQRCRP